MNCQPFNIRYLAESNPTSQHPLPITLGNSDSELLGTAPDIDNLKDQQGDLLHLPRVTETG